MKSFGETGDSHSGYYKHDLRHGYGIYHCQTSDYTYNGLWYNGRQSGLGIYYNNNTSQQQQQLSDNNNHYKNVYQGLWYKGNKHGPGYNIIFHHNQSSNDTTTNTYNYTIVFEIWKYNNTSDTNRNNNTDSELSLISSSSSTRLFQCNVPIQDILHFPSIAQLLLYYNQNNTNNNDTISKSLIFPSPYNNNNRGSSSTNNNSDKGIQSMIKTQMDIFVKCILQEEDKESDCILNCNFPSNHSPDFELLGVPNLLLDEE